MPGKTAVVLFTRDLRVTDNPALWAASRAERTVPLFVLDDAILGSRFAAPNRVAYMREACGAVGIELTAHPGVTVLEPGTVTPTGGEHFKVFSPYHRAWSAAPWREEVGTPRKLAAPTTLAAGALPALGELTEGEPSLLLVAEGEPVVGRGRDQQRRRERGQQQRREVGLFVEGADRGEVLLERHREEEDRKSVV